jgi:hypothetical protein
VSKPAWLTKQQVQAANVARTDDAIAKIDARLASHGVKDLPQWLFDNLCAAPETARVCVMQRIMRENVSRDVLQACRGIMS